VFSAFDAGLNPAKKFKPAEDRKKRTGKRKEKEKEKIEPITRHHDHIASFKTHGIRSSSEP